jgi:hypothetical protein
MEETKIKLETGNLAKEKGFIPNKKETYYNPMSGKTLFEELPATQSLLQKWLREIHNIDVEVVRDSEVHYRDETRWIVRISNWNDIQVRDFPIAQLKFPNYSNHIDFKSYEEALEKGLEEGLKFINNEKI